jgi:eukaryotic-like serine/threonine-protein kinase
MWTVPGYTEVRELSVDAGGRTALARHTATGAPVTIRYLADTERADTDRLARHREEARRLAGLESEHLVGLYEYVEGEGGTATIREHVDGVPLAALLDRATLSPEAAMAALRSVLLALADAWAGGLEPGRYHPSTVLVDAQGRVKLLAGTQPIAGPPASAADDVRAAFATLRAPKPPRRLRGLDEVAAGGDGPALLAALEQAAAARYGPDWEREGREQLGRSVVRHRR